MAQTQIPPGRQALFYFGMLLMVVGFALFISTFFFAATKVVEIPVKFGQSGMSDGPPPAMVSFAQDAGFAFGRAVVGMLLVIVGGIMCSIGKMGLAGSGVKLDPEQARRDVEPWSRMTGGVVKDALDEAGVKLGATAAANEEAKLPFDERLRRLQKLRDDGVVTEAEFEAAKKKILESV